MEEISQLQIINRYNEGIFDLASAKRAWLRSDEERRIKHLRDAGEALSQTLEWALWFIVHKYLPMTVKPGNIKDLVDYYTGISQLCKKKLSKSSEDVDFNQLVSNKRKLTNSAKHNGAVPDYKIQIWYVAEIKKFILLYIDPDVSLSTIEGEMEITNDSWAEFYLACDKFKDEGRNFILVVGESIKDIETNYLKMLSLPRWNLIIDYDYNSESLGFFHKVYAGESTLPHKIKAADNISNDDISQYSHSHYHFFANNFDGAGAPSEPDFSKWDRRYGRNTESFIKSFAGVLSLIHI